MATKTAERAAAKQAAIDTLREIVKPGGTLFTRALHVSRSGMTRHIDVFAMAEERPVLLNREISDALGFRRAADGSLVVTGCGMDMGFSVVYDVSALLYGYGGGYTCLGEGCPSNDHVNAPRQPEDGTSVHRDGYAVSQRWL